MSITEAEGKRKEESRGRKESRLKKPAVARPRSSLFFAFVLCLLLLPYLKKIIPWTEFLGAPEKMHNFGGEEHEDKKKKEGRKREEREKCPKCSLSFHLLVRFCFYSSSLDSHCLILNMCCILLLLLPLLGEVITNPKNENTSVGKTGLPGGCKWTPRAS